MILSQKFFESKQDLDQKNQLGSEKNVVSKTIYFRSVSSENFVFKKYLGPKKFRIKKILGPKWFWFRNFFGSKQDLDQKINWDRKKMLCQEKLIFGQWWWWFSLAS